MILRTFALIAVATMTLLGCKSVDITNGEVPSEYLHLAKKMEGIYEGSFNGVEGKLTVRFEGNKPVVEYSNKNGTDLLNRNCESQIGNLKTVYLKGTKENPQVESVTFKFSSGLCISVEGREIAFQFKNDYNKIEASLLKEHRIERQCTWDSGAPPHVPPREVCRLEKSPVYIWGKFFR